MKLLEPEEDSVNTQFPDASLLYSRIVVTSTNVRPSHDQISHLLVVIVILETATLLSWAWVYSP